MTDSLYGRQECLPHLRRLHSREDSFYQIERADGARADEGFACGKTAGSAAEQRCAADAVEDVGLARRKLRLVATDGCQFLFQRFADIEREMTRIAAEDLRLERQTKIELGLNGVDRQVVEMLVPLGQPRIKHSGVG